MNSRKRVGLFGGSFDPIHHGHVEVAHYVHKNQSLDEVWFLIEKEHRYKNHIAPYENRLEMVKLATKSHEHLVADRLSMQREGRTHSLQTIEELVEQFPDYDFSLIVGVDVFAFLDKWKEVAEFCNIVDFIVVSRPNFDVEVVADMLERLPSGSVPRYRLIRDIDIPISSSLVRGQFEQEKDNCLSPEVAEYALEHGLYSDPGHIGGKIEV